LIRARIRLEDEGAAPGKKPVPDKPLSSFSATPACQRKSQARLLRKWKLYERVQELHAKGMSLRKIGEALGLARNTVRKYFRQAPEPPLPTPRPLRASRLDPYEDYLLQRWSQGELMSLTCVARPQMALRLAHAKSVQRPSRHVHYVGRLSRKRGGLEKEEQARLDQLLHLSPEVQTVYALTLRFLEDGTRAQASGVTFLDGASAQERHS
jgi:transcriptional regulator with XRE-family HTH domain